MENHVAAAQARMDELKEVKFLIPVKHHVNLHSWKLLQNQSISSTIAEALEQYFARRGPGADGDATA